MSDKFHDDIGTASLCGGLDLLYGVVTEKDFLCANLLRLCQTFGNAVDSIDGVNHCQCCRYAAYANRAAANCYCHAGLSIFRREVFQIACCTVPACREDIGHEHQHLLRNSLGGGEQRSLS